MNKEEFKKHLIEYLDKYNNCVISVKNSLKLYSEINPDPSKPNFNYFDYVVNNLQENVEYLSLLNYIQGEGRKEIHLTIYSSDLHNTYYLISSKFNANPSHIYEVEGEETEPVIYELSDFNTNFLQLKQEINNYVDEVYTNTFKKKYGYCGITLKCQTSLTSSVPVQHKISEIEFQLKRIKHIFQENISFSKNFNLIVNTTNSMPIMMYILHFEGVCDIIDSNSKCYDENEFIEDCEKLIEDIEYVKDVVFYRDEEV